MESTGQDAITSTLRSYSLENEENDWNETYEHFLDPSHAKR
jgi:hypothetical protein